MNTSSDSTTGNGKKKRIVMGVLAFLTLVGFMTTFYFQGESQRLAHVVDDGKLHSERLLAEKLQLDKQIAELRVRGEMDQEALGESESKMEALRRRVEGAIAHSKGLESSARKGNRLEKELAALRLLKEQLELKLTTAASITRDAEDQLYNVTVERDALASKLENQQAAASMVNNAEVDALRGKKGRLTVLARRTKELRMAFDMPQNLAQGASFKIIAPDGRNYTGADPSVSMSIDRPEPEPTTSIDLMPLSTTPGERASRVHLKFTPTEKLQPGTYRIDVMAGGEYLNTILLNLR